MPCRRYGDFNLSELISALSAGGWRIMQRNSDEAECVLTEGQGSGAASATQMAASRASRASRASIGNAAGCWRLAVASAGRQHIYLQRHDLFTPCCTVLGPGHLSCPRSCLLQPKGSDVRKLRGNTQAQSEMCMCVRWLQPLFPLPQPPEKVADTLKLSCRGRGVNGTGIPKHAHAL